MSPTSYQTALPRVSHFLDYHTICIDVIQVFFAKVILARNKTNKKTRVDSRRNKPG